MKIDKFFVATKALIEKDGKVLVIRESRRYKDGTQTGKYDVIGGRVEPGQSFDESLLREASEETGLDITIGKPIYVNEVRPTVKGENWQIVRIFFACAPKEEREVVLSEDHDGFKWIDPKNYKNEGLIENLFPVFEAYLGK